MDPTLPILKTMRTQRPKNRGRLGFLFWTAFILFVAVIYLANRDDISTVLESTRFVEIVTTRLRGDDPTVVVERRQAPVPPADGEPGDGSMEQNPAADAPSSQEPTREESPRRTPEGEEPESEDETLRDGATDQPEGEQPEEPEDSQESQESLTALEEIPEEQQEPEPFQRSRESKLFYIRVTEDGSIYPQAVKRPVPFTDSPMTETIKALLSGPTIDELNMGLLNLIPEGTELRSAWVRDGVAYLNFNEAFRFNPMGVEGFLAQLQQVVFSTTEFSTIEEVQILIEGERVDYLGGDGIYIGEPLARSHFSS